MLGYLDEHYSIFPNTIELVADNENDGVDHEPESNVMKYENMNITLGEVHISIEYFCCYDDNTYQNITKLYQEFVWEEFDIYFGEFMCLNMTDIDKTIYVLLLDEESQKLMSEWTDNFEAYLMENGITLLSKPRRNGQPFHSTFAVFDEYNDELESLSIDTLSYLNDNYGSIWSEIPITFSKDNILFV